ncbi:PIG-L family deacetylase [Olivibacter sp. CPCC 100613]|uniref:PIG-L deacetylase family protein n=1 Tax=Olivibacter sp. CPCC 100613 TaxID=3079931 RepID=UPI002FF63957
MDLANKKIAIIIAHPDDEAIGCGGFINKASTIGATSRVILPTRRIDPRGIKHWDELVKQFHDSCKLLGAEAIVTPHATDDLFAEQFIPQIVQEIDPHIQWADIILTHWHGDMHQAHQALSRAVELCTRPFRRHKTVLCFEIATATDQPYFQTFSPNCFVVLDEIDVQKKIDAMRYYDTEQIAGRFAENLKHQLSYRGNQIGTSYAESFMLMRHFIY